MFRNVFKKKHTHSFIITNVFCTLIDVDQFDIVKSCTSCSVKEAFETDKQTLMELVEKFPNAFEPLLRSYVELWKT